MQEIIRIHHFFISLTKFVSYRSKLLIDTLLFDLISLPKNKKFVKEKRRRNEKPYE